MDKHRKLLRVISLFVMLLLCRAGQLLALDAIPLYEPIVLGNLIRDTYPTASISTAAALNEEGHAVGFGIVDNEYTAYIYTETHGVDFLPGLAGFTSHKAADVSDPDASGVVRIAGYSMQSIYSEPGRAVMWLYDTIAGTVAETIDVGILPGYTSSTLVGINDFGLAIGRSVGGSTVPFTTAMVFDETTRTLYPVDLPFAPIGINNTNQVAGGTFRAQLIPVAGGWGVGTLEDLGVPPDTWGGRISAINQNGDVAGYTIQPYGDGNGRYVKAATRYTDVWRILWSNSAFDGASGLNNLGDVVGTLGISSATRGALYIEALNQTYLVEDLTDPPGFVDYLYDINDAGWLAGGAAGAVVYKLIGEMPPPTSPLNLTAEPHLPTWQQPWNAITLAWENTSTRTWDYSIERRVAGTTAWSIIRENWSVTSMWDMDVELATTYDYRVRARGIAGFSGYSNIATATSPSEPVDTSAPTATFVTPLDGETVSGNVTVTVNFEDDRELSYLEISTTDGYSTETICTGAGNGQATATLSCNWNTNDLLTDTYPLHAYVSDTMGNGSNTTIHVFVEGTGYCNFNYTCDAGEDCHSCPTDCAGVTSGKPKNRYCCGDGICSDQEDSSFCAIDCNPPAPMPPTGLTAVGSDDAITLNWNDNTEPDLDYYNVYRSLTSSTGYVQIQTGINSSSYVDNSVSNGVTYYYTVTAVTDSVSESAMSDEASAIAHMAGDLNYDGLVNLFDVQTLANGWQVIYQMDTLMNVAQDWLQQSSP